MLTFLGKKITVTPLTFDGNTAAGLIKQHAARTSADLVVQGAYGRSRWSELILGGVTREMLRDSALPVLMSHQRCNQSVCFGLGPGAATDGR